MAAVVGVIPARYAATRFPGKPLIDLLGKSMIQRVWEGARTARLLDTLLIATPDAVIAQHARTFGAVVVETPNDFPSGSDRIAWVIRHHFPNAQIVLNIQGDEPLITGTVLDTLITRLLDTPQADAATLVQPMSDEEEVTDPAIVKVVFDQQHYALYFSRAPIPYVRHQSAETTYFKHIGIYAFRAATLEAFVQLPPGRLEQLEGLEQLRLLENGKSLLCVDTRHPFLSVDTPEDAEKVRRFLAQQFSVRKHSANSNADAER